MENERVHTIKLTSKSFPSGKGEKKEEENSNDQNNEMFTLGQLDKKVTNGFTMDLYYKRLLTIDKCLFYSIIFQNCLLHCYHELDLVENESAIYFLHASCVVGVISIITSILRHISYNHLQQEYGLVYEQATYICLFFKILLFCLMPSPFLEEITFKTMVYDSELSEFITLNYKINYFLIIVSMLRIAFALNVLFQKSRYLSPRSNRICKMYGADPGILFCLKANFKDNPFLFITSIFLGSIVVFTFAFRICQIDQTNLGIVGTYENLVWMTIITMTTVGYGDFTPKSEIGRIIGCVCVSWGVLIVSVMVVVLTNTFSMDKNEWQSLATLKKLEMDKKIRVISAEFLRESVWRLWTNKKYHLHKQEKMKERKLMNEFKLLRRQKQMSLLSQNEIDLFNSMTRHFQKSFIYVDSLTENNLMIVDYLHEEYIFKNGLDIPLEIKKNNSRKSSKDS